MKAYGTETSWSDRKRREELALEPYYGILGVNSIQVGQISYFGSQIL